MRYFIPMLTVLALSAGATLGHANEVVDPPLNQMRTVSRSGSVVGQGTYAVTYPVSQDETIARYLAKVLRDCGPHMDEAADDEQDFECRIDVAGFEAPDGIISLQITHSRQDFGRMQHWEEAQVFAPTGSGYKALTPSEIISDSTVCKQLVGKALLKESVNPKEDQAPIFDGLTPEEIFDAMWVAAVHPHRVEFWKSGFAGIPSILTVPNQDLGACLVVRKGWLESRF